MDKKESLILNRRLTPHRSGRPFGMLANVESGVELRVDLKKVKIARSLSEETTAFTAQLWVEGEYIAVLTNDGRGGATHIRHLFNDRVGLNTRAQVTAFEKWCKNIELSPCCRACTTFVEGVLCCKVCYAEVSHGGIGAERYINLLLEDYEEEQQVKRWCKKMTVVRLEGDKPGEFHTYKKIYDSEFAQRIRTTEPKLLEIINERYIKL